MKILKKDEIITDQTIVDNDITSSYEPSQRPNRLGADTSTLIRRLSGQVYIVSLVLMFMDQLYYCF